MYSMESRQLNMAAHRSPGDAYFFSPCGARANPPFNYHPWNQEKLVDDVRWKYGLPPAGNANYAWIQHMIHHLAPNGKIGLVLANGALSTQSSGEGEIRKRIIEDDLIEGIVALPTQLFYSVTIPVILAFSFILSSIGVTTPRILSCTSNEGNSKSFPGKLLIIRDNTPDSGFDFKDFAYEAVIKRILGTPKSDHEISGIRNRINISKEFDAQWRVYTSNPDAAMPMLYKNTDLYKRLLDSRRLSFVLYRDDEILLGGKYSFDLLKGTSEEIRADCEQAMDGLFNEAFAASLSAEYPVVQ